MYISVYDIRKKWLEDRLGAAPSTYDSEYSISLAILNVLGGDATARYDSLYSVDKAILNAVGGDSTVYFDSLYSVDKQILAALGGDLSVYYDSVYSIWLKILELSPSIDYLLMPFTIESVGDSNLIFAINSTSDTPPNLEYSLDNVEWLPFTIGDNYEVEDKMYLRGNNSTLKLSSFSISDGYCNLSGNIMSLLNSEDFAEITTLEEEKIFYRFFRMQTNIIDCSELYLSASVLSQTCYFQMFYGCTNLTYPPKMLATTLAYQCCSMMFQNCTSLAKTPQLYAQTLEGYCYHKMFNGCTNLTLVEVFANDITAQSATSLWLANVASEGKFINYGNADFLVDDNSGIPSGWTEVRSDSIEYDEQSNVHINGEYVYDDTDRLTVIAPFGPEGDIDWITSPFDLDIE